MMSVLEYAQDMNKSVEEIIKMCGKLGIDVENEDDMLSDDSIVELDNAFSNEPEEESVVDEIINKYKCLSRKKWVQKKSGCILPAAVLPSFQQLIFYAGKQVPCLFLFLLCARFGIRRTNTGSGIMPSPGNC